jgi:hypothetical protein
VLIPKLQGGLQALALDRALSTDALGIAYLRAGHGGAMPLCSLSLLLSKEDLIWILSARRVCMPVRKDRSVKIVKQ